VIYDKCTKSLQKVIRKKQKLIEKLRALKEAYDQSAENGANEYQLQFQEQEMIKIQEQIQVDCYTIMKQGNIPLPSINDEREYKQLHIKAQSLDKDTNRLLREIYQDKQEFTADPQLFA